MKKIAHIALAVVTISSLVAFGPSATASPGGPADQANVLHESQVPQTFINKYAARTTSSTDISYHNGPVMTGANNVYVIWYGNWAASKTTIINDFLTNLGGSPYHLLNGAYYNTAKVKVGTSLTVKGQTSVSDTTLGKTLTDANIQTIVSKAINGNAFGTTTPDTNGIYIVLTAGDIAESSGFLTKYCGWHTFGTMSTKPVKYAFVGDPSASLATCAGQTASSPNGDPAVDAMISVIAHEIAETVTDPQLNAWYDNKGMENADKCAWNFGTTYATANGSKANMKLGTRDYLIQQNWALTSPQGCALK